MWNLGGFFLLSMITIIFSFFFPLPPPPHTSPHPPSYISSPPGFFTPAQDLHPPFLQLLPSWLTKLDKAVIVYIVNSGMSIKPSIFSLEFQSKLTRDICCSLSILGYSVISTFVYIVPFTDYVKGKEGFR